MADERRLPTWAQSLGIALALAVMMIWSFSQRWSVLTSTPFPLGVDGYFYPVQLRSLLETGELQYPASPLAFWLLAPFAAATDPITGAKLGAAVLGALVALPAYAVGMHLGGRDDDGRGPGLVAAAVAVSSSGSMYMTIEFVKNGIGLTVALTALWLVLRCLDKPARGRIVAAVAGIVAAVLAHKMAAAIVIGMAIPAVGVELYGRGIVTRRRLAAAVAIAVAAIAIVVIAGAIAPRRLVSYQDLALLDGLFTSEPRWALPVLGDGRLTLAYEPWFALVVAVVAAVVMVVERVRAPRAPRGRDAIAWAAIALALFIGLPWLDVDSTQGLGMRLRIIAFVPLALCAAIVASAIARVAMRERAKRFGACAALAAGAILVRTGGGLRTEGQVVTHPALVSSAQALVGRIPEGDTAIVPERHIAFMIAWYTRARISIRPEPVAEERRWRVMPLAFIRRTSRALDGALLEIRRREDLPRVIGLHPLAANGMVAVPEQTWRAVLATLPDADRARLTAWPTI